MDNLAEQLRDMGEVHGFYTRLLEEVLGSPVPVPAAVQSPPEQTAEAAQDLERWLSLLDLAISPPMVRDALKETTSRATAEALLRYFARKGSLSDVDRDKTDFVVTFLYRRIIPPERQAPAVDLQEAEREKPSEFEQEIAKVLGEPGATPLPEAHRQLVREFPFIRQEVDDLRHFDQLMDSGLIQRVREIKERFGPSFYHPRVLAACAEYNIAFGRRFDELFRAATKRIKLFADNLQEHGGSILTRVDGDVTVKNLADVEESKILHTEYGRAQEHLRRISKFKKAVDTRSQGRFAGTAPASPTATAPTGESKPEPPPLIPPTPTASFLMSAPVEESKLRAMRDSIQSFVRAADPRSASVVPLKKDNLVLTPAEVEAFRATYLGEKSFRGDFAETLCQVIAAHACIMTELMELKAKSKSAYLWKPHADSLAFLVARAQKLQEECEGLMATAEKRGLADKASGMKIALQKLHAQAQTVAQALQSLTG